MIELSNLVQVRFRSLRTGKYLRLNKQGGVDAQAGKSPDSVFLVHRVDANQIKLQSCEDPTKWLGFTEDGELNDRGKGSKSIFVVKYSDDRDKLTLSPNINLDWHIGCDNVGRIRKCSEVSHDKTAGFSVELVDCQMVRNYR